ncbi:MAG: MBL fold metallo-hydrolase [Pseudomonadota bacterium]
MTDTPLSFDRSAPQAGSITDLGHDIYRVIAPNPSAFTFTGTASYVLGGDHLAIIDPGPDDDAHYDRLVEVIAGRPVHHIIVTHTHRDHVALADRLAQALGAETVGATFTPRDGSDGTSGLDAAHDQDFMPDIALSDGMRLNTAGVTLEAIATPGHAANHFALGLEDTGVVFTGDHVMGWSTSVVAPPDGHMGDYMRSLEKLLTRNDTLYLPGHGDRIGRPERFVRGLITHRRQRETKILDALRAGDRTIGEIVKRAYPGLDPKLVGAASLSTRAQLIYLTEQGLAREEDQDAWTAR